jgi:hypothetical protein
MFDILKTLIQEVEMKKWALAFSIVFLCGPLVFTQENQDADVRKEIKNLVSAVKAANPGDYILLPSDKKYILTKEEIDIVNGYFDYADLSNVKTETRDDGTEIKTISESHVAYIYPDGQSTHVLKTNVSFTPFLQHIEERYYITRYIDGLNDLHDYRPVNSPRFNVFRASVQFQTISNGVEELESVTVTTYNYRGENFIMKYCGVPDMFWGNISEDGAYKPTGETRQIEFDVE